ncbi:HipA domain-containing protein [Sphingopyxis granuli]|uniref:HipA domain-containing protein n=1 Tax=Sphingopyxis granuli TaxID=267128 RepID=UPI0020D05EFB|nr:HipA domain-containing protein [Sphingopyxis granuli]
MVDALAQHGSQGKTDAHALYRRVAFNVLISNVDDHLRNHGFLWRGKAGWSLSPAYDLNPVPADLKARVLTTNIDLLEVASAFLHSRCRRHAPSSKKSRLSPLRGAIPPRPSAPARPRSRAWPAPSHTVTSPGRWRCEGCV